MAKTYSRQEFVEKYGGFAHRVVKGTGIHAGTLLSQAILESQGKVNGSYRVGASTLSQNANNYFGIKCGATWKGKGFNIDTGEKSPDGSSYIHRNACFRAYDSIEDSMKDYVNLLTTKPVYAQAGVLTAPDVRSQAEALKRAGYATATNYPATIASIHNGIKDYVDKFSRYGIGGVARSFANNPVSFVKRNKWAVLTTTLVLTGIGFGIYFATRKK